jgi:hypothetical protein
MISGVCGFAGRLTRTVLDEMPPGVSAAALPTRLKEAAGAARRVPKGGRWRPEVSAQLQAVVERCLEERKGMRFPSVQALCDALIPFDVEPRLDEREAIEDAAFTPQLDPTAPMPFAQGPAKPGGGAAKGWRCVVSDRRPPMTAGPLGVPSCATRWPRVQLLFGPPDRSWWQQPCSASTQDAIAASLAETPSKAVLRRLRRRC